MKSIRVVILWLLAVAVVGGAFAQRPVPELQDLVGARARDGEREMEERGYKWVHTEKLEDSAEGFWRDNRDGRCIFVTTREGRYEAIVYTPNLACERGESDSASESEESSAGHDEFATVCGVAFEGKIHPYKCKAVDIYKGSKKAKTEVHFPDQVVTLRWRGPNKVAVEVEGLETREAKWNVAGDDINWYLDDKTYFYCPDKKLAKKKLDELKK